MLPLCLCLHLHPPLPFSLSVSVGSRKRFLPHCPETEKLARLYELASKRCCCCCCCSLVVVVALLSSLAALELWLRRWPWTLFIATFVQIAVRCDAENQFHLGNILYDIVVGTRQAQAERETGRVVQRRRGREMNVGQVD